MGKENDPVFKCFAQTALRKTAGFREKRFQNVFPETHKPSLAVFLIIMIAAVSLAACSSGQPTPGEPPLPTATALPTATPQPTVAPPATVGLDPGFALGGQVPGFIAHAQLMRDTGMSWVKYQLKWNAGVTPETANTFIEQGHSQGLKVLLSISGDAFPTSIDFAGYIAFLEAVAAYRPDAIEVWNEMNLDREWVAGQISPESYVNDMLAPAYAAIKAVSPDTAVIIGAPAPTGFDNEVNAWSDQRYVAGLYETGAASYADCIGMHHNSGTTSPSARTGHISDSGDGHYSWYFLPTLEMYYNGMGGELPVCITEFGYLTPEGISDPLPELFAWGADNTLDEQAAWLAEGAQLSKDLGYVPLMIVWNVDFTHWTDTDPFKGYAILRDDGSCPACDALAAVMGR
jgi:hypothetical protein